MAATYDVGDLVRVTGTFTNAAGAAVDPTVVTFTFRTPAGVATTYTYGVDAQLVKSATGVYYVDINVTAPQYWYCRFVSTGSGQAAGPHVFWVRPNDF